MKMLSNTFLPVFLLVVISISSGCSKDETSKPETNSKRYVLRDIEYAVNTDTAGISQHLTLDIFFTPKADTSQKFPLVLMIHGGSFQIGDKDWVSESCNLLAEAGFITATINYRLGWRDKSCNGALNTLAEANYRGMQDANAALRFLVAHAEEYGIDTNWIFVAGESAGATTALNSSYIPENRIHSISPLLAQKLGGLHNSGNKYNKTYSLKGICNKWGAIMDTNLISGNFNIPVISFHGSNDRLVPVENGYLLECSSFPVSGSACIHRQTIASEGISILYLSQNGMHQPKEYTPEFTMNKTAEFFQRIMTGTAESAVYSE
jgi:predicted peptidase